MGLTKKTKRWVWIIRYDNRFRQDIVYVCDSEEKSDAYLDKHPDLNLVLDEYELH